jgi:hypothetical protein
MKIDELKNPQPQLNEGFLDTLLGAAPGEVSAGIKSAFNPGMTTKAQLAKDIFIKEFVADGIASLQNAVKSGVVVPGTAAPAEKKKTDPVEKKKNAASTDPYENLKGQIRRLQPKPNAQPLPNDLVVKLNSDMEKLAKGDKESGIYAANEILKLANDGYNVSNLTSTWKAKSKAGDRPLTQSVYRAITNMLSEHGLTWDNLGLRTRLYEGPGNSGVLLSRCNPIPVTTPEFKKMDQVFESIVAELFGNKQPVEGAERISSFMMDWFGKWMYGVNWQGRKPQVQSLINAIETSYPNGNWKGAIRQLARAAYAYSNASSSLPKGVKNAKIPAGKQPTNTANRSSSMIDVLAGGGNTDAEEQIKQILKNNPSVAKKYNIKP